MAVVSVSVARAAGWIGAKDRNRAIFAVEAQFLHRQLHRWRIDMALNINVELGRC
jgi:hypothetical protein